MSRGAPLCRVPPTALAKWRRGLTTSLPPSGQAAPTPDFTTPVNVADIHLSRPERKPPAQAKVGSWVGLEGLEERTQGSLIESTLLEMEGDNDFQITAARLREIGAKRMSLEERKQRRRALESLGVPDFASFVNEHAPACSTPTRSPTEVLQLNIGIYCNQACAHCHVESSPRRTEHMNEAVAAQCLELLVRSPSVHTLDLTGGAPEMQPAFRTLVTETRARAPHVKEIIDRCNLTVLCVPYPAAHLSLAGCRAAVLARL
jgi:hypothetical protein